VTSRREAARKPQLTLYPDGPVLVRGDVEILQADGSPLPRRRKTVALCRCGHSGLMPLCDGTHAVLRKPGRDSPLARKAASED
jgi:CDGSH-type Zn-finger protein